MIDPNSVAKIVESKKESINHNAMLFDMYEGNLMEYILSDLKKQLSPQVYAQQLYRVCPINILPKIIEKLTNIYQTAVIREVINGTDSDEGLMRWYASSFNVNRKMNESNEYFNLTKSSLLYPYVSKGSPRLRVIKNDRFVLHSSDPIEPNKPTLVTLLGDKEDGKDIYWTWTATDFLISDSEGRTRYDLMSNYGNPEGINPIGRLPFVYINESEQDLYPTKDTDTITMVKLLPVMCSDLNLAAMFQCFSIIFGIDVSDTNLQFAPNAFWSLKSDPTSDKRPEIGTIKPQVDYDQVLNLIQSQLTMWLSSKGIRAGSIGTLTAENAASGISKLIDEMDTYEARQKQTTVFEMYERELWDLVLNYMHPYWSGTGMISNGAVFTPSAAVAVKFAVQLPTQTRGAVVRDVKEEYAAGFISRRRALAKLNPDMTESEIDELEKEIDDERALRGGVINGESDGATAGDSEGADTGAA